MNPRQEEPISHTFNKLSHSHSITKHTCRLKHAYNDLTRPQARTDTTTPQPDTCPHKLEKEVTGTKAITINNGCLKAPFVLLSCLCESVCASVSVGGCWPGGHENLNQMCRGQRPPGSAMFMPRISPSS